jgi:TRAP-type C4-dicarboxylate transport system substrate-binding protein
MSRGYSHALRIAILALSGLFAAALPSRAQETTLTAIVSLPKTNSINTPFLNLIEEVDKTGAGKMKIRFVGGPEVMPANEQMSAISRGVTDMYYGATAYYLGQIPEMTAFSGSNKSAMRLREEGQIDWLDQFFEKKLNVKLLGYYGSGYAFHIYLRRDPTLTADGGIDLKGLKVRGSPSYAAQYEALGLVRLNTSPAEVYTALERGLLDGVGFPTMGVTDSGWEKFLRYRIFPTFKQGDLAIVMNLDKWKKLTQAQRDFLQAMCTKYERIAHDYFVADAKAEQGKLTAAGMKDIRLTGAGAQRYLAAFYDTLWAPLEAKVGKPEADEIKKRFYDPAASN